jgi:hypothetical protein
LDEVLDAVADARQKFAPSLLKARHQTKVNLASVRSAQRP